MRFKCNENLFMYYWVIGAQFAKGEFQTEDPAQIEYLRSRPEVDVLEEVEEAIEFIRPARQRRSTK